MIDTMTNFMSFLIYEITFKVKQNCIWPSAKNIKSRFVTDISKEIPIKLFGRKQRRTSKYF